MQKFDTFESFYSAANCEFDLPFEIERTDAGPAMHFRCPSGRRGSVLVSDMLAQMGGAPASVAHTCTITGLFGPETRKVQFQIGHERLTVPAKAFAALVGAKPRYEPRLGDRFTLRGKLIA